MRPGGAATAGAGGVVATGVGEVGGRVVVPGDDGVEPELLIQEFLKRGANRDPGRLLDPSPLPGRVDFQEHPPSRA